MSDAYRQSSRNAVLVKDDVGRAKPTVYDLPPESHAYGRSEVPDLEGAREVTMNWAPHVPRPKPQHAGTDFRLINKMAARSKVGNAKDLAVFRSSADFPLVPPGPAGVAPKVIPSDVIPSFAYGRKSRPSTPINAVIGGHYAVEFEEAQNMKYSRAAEMKGPPGKTKVRLTKSTIAHIQDVRQKKAAQEERLNNHELWTMKKFRNIPGKMSLAEMGRAASEPNLHSHASHNTPSVDLRSRSTGSPFQAYGDF